MEEPKCVPPRTGTPAPGPSQGGRGPAPGPSQGRLGQAIPLAPWNRPQDSSAPPRSRTEVEAILPGQRRCVPIQEIEEIEDAYGSAYRGDRRRDDGTTRHYHAPQEVPLR